MFETSLSSPFLGGAASATTLILALIAFISWVKKRKALVYYSLYRHDYLRGEPDTSVSIRFEGEGFSSEKLYTDFVLISNYTDEAIDETSFMEPLRFNAPIGSVASLDISWDPLKKTIARQEGEELQLVQTAVPPRDGLVIRCTHDGRFSFLQTCHTRRFGTLRRYDPRQVWTDLAPYLSGFLFAISGVFALPATGMEIIGSSLLLIGAVILFYAEKIAFRITSYNRTSAEKFFIACTSNYLR
ncbi:hypothetical protein SAMN04488020_10792 [Palleronia marisminoris]|uniref:Uncharacterized protein n=1 Tax=Palleronia marisminoris TaxID=315423 RepID=A0A1Y5T2A7_9RHOB|nr:hypothetical protein [Palleronia marisminoris]SFH14458.1 hypothetical protein SAMN04488020_10792 [Palleronia marisminoris]SLN54342.1 hypothetical protein PAM7066_02565 [Palleronia marisminoris]